MTDTSAVKYCSLIFLVFQNSALILSLRYSRILPGPKYSTSTAVLLSELIKCLLSLIAYGYCRSIGPQIEDDMTDMLESYESQKPQIDKTPQAIIGLNERHIKSIRRDLTRMAVPAVLYTIQNNLQFIAVTNLEAATFQVMYQAKILTTATCAVIFLGTRLSRQQVGSIFLLTIGVAAASVPQDKSDAGKHVRQNHAVGIMAVAAACVLSGFAGVYTEMILKKTQHQREGGSKNEKFWLRNIQLSFISVLFSMPGVWILDREHVSNHDILYGFNLLVWTTILLQAMGGLAVALVVTHADNILKSFATSISMLVSAIISLISEKSVSPLFAFGLVSVLVATWSYGIADQRHRCESCERKGYGRQACLV